MALTNAERRRRYYAANKERHAASIKAGRERARQLVIEYKQRPCADCGRSYPYYVMDLDHRVLGDKAGSITALIHAKGWRGQRVLDELAKCDVVCANCHRLRHPPEQFSSGGCVRAR